MSSFCNLLRRELAGCSGRKSQPAGHCRIRVCPRRSTRVVPGSVSEVQAHHAGCVIRVWLLARSGTRLARKLARKPCVVRSHVSPCADDTPTWRLGSALVVLVVAVPPDARLVAPLGGAVEPLVHAPKAVQSARIGGVGVVDDAVLEHEGAHTWPFARVGGCVGSANGREPGDGLRDRCRIHRMAAAPVVVLDDPLALLRLGERDVEVEVEVAVERGRPGKRPPIRRLYACSFASGARDTAESVTSWFARCTVKPSNPSAIVEQDGHPAV